MARGRGKEEEGGGFRKAIYSHVHVRTCMQELSWMEESELQLSRRDLTNVLTS